MKLTPINSLVLAGGLLSIGFIAAESDTGGPVEMKQLMDFESEEKAPKWFAVNDGVMGGLSKGQPEIKAGALHFRGDLSLENNGGFSSIRTNGSFDFSGKEALVMRVKGDGRTYQLRLQTDALYRGSEISYGANFDTKQGQWIEVKIPLEKLSPSWRGRRLDGPPLDLSKIGQIGLLLGDKKAGSFALEVDWIAVE